MRVSAKRSAWSVSCPDSCTQNPDEVPGEVCPGYKYKSDTILFPSIGFGPGFEYKPLDEFRDLSAAKQSSRTYSGI
jgi:hypothetical protein